MSRYPLIEDIVMSYKAFEYEVSPMKKFLDEFQKVLDQRLDKEFARQSLIGLMMRIQRRKLSKEVYVKGPQYKKIELFVDLMLERSRILWKDESKTFRDQRESFWLGFKAQMIKTRRRNNPASMVDTPEALQKRGLEWYWLRGEVERKWREYGTIEKMAEATDTSLYTLKSFVQRHGILSPDTQREAEAHTAWLNVDGEYSATVLAREFKVSRQTAHKWIKKWETEPDK